MADQILTLMERGEEHIARERYGDAAMDAALRGSLAQDGWDFDACLADANGWGR